ncbi:MAG TPA: hypothetical protein VFS00_06900 [Polyangiaceae bacterium]|nr:hypothetical protein [Polyangiaceae bacterium]
MNAKISLPLSLGGLAAAFVGAALAGCELVAGIEEKELVTPLAAPATAPERPPGARTPSDRGRVVAVAAREFFFGTRNVNDRQPNRNAWRDIGFDLDRLCTKDEKISASNPAACQIDPARNAAVLEDGAGCRDNSFGRNVANNTDLTLAGDLDALTNTGVLDGTTPTYVIVLRDYDDGPDDPYVPGTLYLTESTPGQNVEELWDDATLRTMAKGAYEFRDGYRRGNTWVSGDPAVGERTFPFVFWERAVDLKADVAFFTLQLRDGGRGGALGNVGLAVPGQNLGASLAPLLTDLLLDRRLGGDPAQCSAAGGLTQGLLGTVSAYVDLAKVGFDQPRPVDNSAPCSMLSIGIAFDAVPTQAPEGEGANPASPERLCEPPPPPPGGGNERECGLEPDCKLCCAAEVTNPTFVVAVRGYFDTCLCEPARQSVGSGGGQCANVVPGCEGCCDRLCNGGGVAPADLAECDTCAAEQGAGIAQCDDLKSFCQTNYSDIVCSEYINCVGQSRCDGDG